MNKTSFEISTKFGLITVLINGVNSFYLSNDKKDERNTKNLITIRGKNYSNFSVHCGLLPVDAIGIKTYDFDGNTPIFAEDKPDNDYFKIKSIYLSGNLKEATESAKKALYFEISEQINKFYEENKKIIKNIWQELSKEYKIEKIQCLKDKIAQMNQEIEKVQAEINELEK